MALTSHIMKTLERLILEQLRPMDYGRVFYFSSEFDNIHLALLGDKLKAMQVDAALECGLSHLQTTVCALKLLCVGQSAQQSQGTVLSPFDFTLYISDFSYRFCSLLPP